MVWPAVARAGPRLTMPRMVRVGVTAPPATAAGGVAGGVAAGGVCGVTGGVTGGVSGVVGGVTGGVTGGGAQVTATLAESLLLPAASTSLEPGASATVAVLTTLVLHSAAVTLWVSV